MKVVVSTTLEADEIERLQRMATADHRSLASTIRLAVISGLPALEKEILGARFVGQVGLGLEQSRPKAKQNGKASANGNGNGKKGAS